MKIVKSKVWSLGLLALISCKKEKLPEVTPPTCTERCNYISDFVGHHWKQVGDCEDSSTYALNNIGLMPLPTSYSYTFNACDTDNVWIINSNGSSYVPNLVKCSSSEPDTFFQPAWNFSADRKQLIFTGASTFYIQSITPSEMKLYYYFTVTPIGQQPIRFVRLWTYKSI